MIAAHACPRCRGTLTRVADVGDTYFSCVQCGNVVYDEVATVTALPTEARWQGPQASDRSAVRRRLIARDRAAAAKRAA
jgi:hypothetical protein